MKLKYCKNCKYSTRNSFYVNQPDCVGTIYLYCALEFTNPCSYYNEDGRCEKYKRKWYKFWVK